MATSQRGMHSKPSILFKRSESIPNTPCLLSLIRPFSQPSLSSPSSPSSASSTSSSSSALSPSASSSSPSLSRSTSSAPAACPSARAATSSPSHSPSISAPKSICSETPAVSCTCSSDSASAKPSVASPAQSRIHTLSFRSEHLDAPALGAGVAVKKDILPRHQCLRAATAAARLSKSGTTGRAASTAAFAVNARRKPSSSLNFGIWKWRSSDRAEQRASTSPTNSSGCASTSGAHLRSSTSLTPMDDESGCSRAGIAKNETAAGSFAVRSTFRSERLPTPSKPTTPTLSDDEAAAGRESLAKPSRTLHRTSMPDASWVASFAQVVASAGSSLRRAVSHAAREERGTRSALFSNRIGSFLHSIRACSRAVERQAMGSRASSTRSTTSAAASTSCNGAKLAVRRFTLRLSFAESRPKRSSCSWERFCSARSRFLASRASFCASAATTRCASCSSSSCCLKGHELGMPGSFFFRNLFGFRFASLRCLR
mmetsp:Transcript_13469/g.30956  ORF Transcript_13469/g.30956 Transcript_13469/m.30956 type:complete len:486 (-) Transcript_13469:127-1584(-)